MTLEPGEKKKAVQEIHKKTDVYSLSIVFLEIITRSLAWPQITDETDIANKKISKNEMFDPNQLDSFKAIMNGRGAAESTVKFISFVENGLSQDPDGRPSLVDLILPSA